ncbi:MAG: TonB-dependent receptor [Prevotellaceae bacterium]|jgi:TonB-linked SusC/RagA family outer membrane protein|nr:TonB-dependent receptor [Prevotellaceae bacterium]
MKYVFLLLTLCLPFMVLAQEGTVKVSGTVMSEDGETLPGVTVSVKGTNIGTITNSDGRFTLEKIPVGATVTFSYLGYKTAEVVYTANREKERIALTSDVSEMEEVVITGRGAQRKISVVGAITSVETRELQVPATSVSNMLGARVPGIISVTRSGEPGSDFSEFWVRGIATFGASQSALVLIDGIEGSLNDLDPADIESFSVLKDASATAVYGTRGANGVVVVTTKRGKAGKMHISFKTNTTYSYSPRMPEYADAYQYATLANEARVVRGNNAVYTPTEVELFRTGLDPDLYPNVSWGDVILKDHVWNTQHHLSISGGGENARYYVSIGALNNEALFKQDKESPYSANVDYHKYNFRSNVDASITPSTTLSLNMETVFVSQNSPGFGDDNKALWLAQANLPPTMVPVRYSNGMLPSYGVNGDQMSPYVQLNYTGYKVIERYTTKTNAALKQDLSMLTEGLSIQGLFSLTTNGHHQISNKVTPDLYFANPKTGRYTDGSLRTERRVTAEALTSQQLSNSDRLYYFETQANYARVFNGDHRVTGLFHFYRQESKNSTWGSTIFAVIPKRYQAYSGRATYSYKDTYLIEGNIGYTGSENFNKEQRYGVFPSIALGWIPSQYEFFKSTLPFFDYLKLRGSYGQVGNDRLKDSNNNDVRFPYLTIIQSGGTGIWGGSGLTESQVGAVNMQWETTTKYDLGIDGKLFNNRVDFTVDVYRNKATGIFQKRESVPPESGINATLPFANIGSMTSWGLDGNASITQPVVEDMYVTLRGNFTLARNKVDYWEQAGVNFPYQSYSGVPYGIMRGLIAEGLFKNEEDIISSPKQTYMENVLPGDIKYKDVNGDGVIDNDDVVPLSFSNIPQIQYGLALELTYKGFRINALLEAVKDVEYFLGGSGYYPFAGEETGNVLSMVANQANRWTPASYSGDLSTENPNARFPRLTYGENLNNNRNSTFWLADGSYMRLKNVELAYSLPQKWMRKTKVFESATLSVIGENLYVWDKMEGLWDPAQASDNGAVYPLQRKYTMQLFVTF